MFVTFVTFLWSCVFFMVNSNETIPQCRGVQIRKYIGVWVYYIFISIHKNTCTYKDVYIIHMSTSGTVAHFIYYYFFFYLFIYFLLPFSLLYANCNSARIVHTYIFWYLRMYTCIHI